MLKELKEIAAALKEMKSSKGVGPWSAGKPESAQGDSEASPAGRQAGHAEEVSGGTCCSQQDTVREKRLNLAADPGLAEHGHPGSGSNEQAAMSSTEQSRHEHSAQPAEGNGHRNGQEGQTGQTFARQAHHKAAVDKGVQAAPTAHRVPVQAVLLTPTAPAHQVSLAPSCAQGHP